MPPGAARRSPPEGPSAPAPARAALLALGFALPWVACWAVYARLGHVPELIDWVVTRNVGYVGTGATSPWPRLLLALLVCVAAAAPLPWFLAVREARQPYQPIRAGLALVLALTWLPVSAGGRFYEHYFLQFVPPLALLAAPQAVALGRRLGDLARGWRVTIALLLVAPVLGYLAFSLGAGLAGRYPGQDPTALAVASWVDAHSSPGERLFLWGHFSPVYCLAQRLPGTRFISTAWHVGNFDPQHLPRRVRLRAVPVAARRRPHALRPGAELARRWWWTAPRPIFTVGQCFRWRASPSWRPTCGRTTARWRPRGTARLPPDQGG